MDIDSLSSSYHWIFLSRFMNLFLLTKATKVHPIKIITDKLSIISLPALLLGNISSATEVSIHSDRPGLLEFTLELSGHPDHSSGTGWPAYCDRCTASPVPGEPQRPYFSFAVISTDETPQVKVIAGKMISMTFSDGVSPVPEYDESALPIYRKDSDLYSKASQLEPIIGSIRRLRGIPIRTIAIPLAAWDPSAKTMRLVEDVKISVIFPGAYNKAVKGAVPGFLQEIILNPAGGLYNVKAPEIPGLMKPAGIHVRIPDGSELVKISIGDKDIGSMDESGMYRVTFDLLERTGFRDLILGRDLGSIRLYAGGSLLLTEGVNGPAHDGKFREIPIEVNDVNRNGTFDSGDEVLFFGHGTSFWERLNDDVHEGTPVKYRFNSNPYSFYNHYYMGFHESGNAPLRLGKDKRPSPIQPGINQTWAWVRAEKDEALGLCDYSGTLDGASGKNWHWFTVSSDMCTGTNLEKTFTSTSLSLTDGTFKGLVPDSGVFLGFFTVGANQMYSPDPFIVTFSGGRRATYREDMKSSHGSWYFYKDGLDESSFGNMSVQWKTTRSVPGFDGLTMVFLRKLSYTSRPIRILPQVTDGKQSYRITGANSLNALKLIDGVAVSKIDVDPDGILTDSSDADLSVSFYVYSNTDITDIKAEQMKPEKMMNPFPSGSAAPQYLIIAPDIFMSQALKLAKFREGNARSKRYRTHVVRTEDIYRQYSGGRLSPPAIREYIRFGYYGWKKNTSVPDTSLTHVLLFGDGHFDYRNINVDPLSAFNHIPPFEDDGLTTDDYFAYLDEGEHPSVSGSLGDLAIGRVPVKTILDAENFITKAMSYENPQNAGPWRNILLNTADDDFQKGGSGDWDPISRGHTTDAEALMQQVLNHEPGKIKKQIYLLDYEHNYVNAKPEAAQDLINNLNNGVLIANYVGHGGSEVWADEGLLVLKRAISGLVNKNKYPLINSFSCTVGRFDMGEKDGLSEALVNLPDAGAMATVSGTRVTYAGANINLGLNFYHALFEPNLGNDLRSVGAALLEAKILSQSIDNNQRYNILGEPVLMIRKPDLNIRLTGFPDTIRSLDCGHINGKISGGSGSGRVNIQFFSGRISYTFPGMLDGQGIKRTEDQFIQRQGTLLFSGTADYNNGQFSLKYLFKDRLPTGDSTAYMKIFAWDKIEENEGSLNTNNLVLGGISQSCKMEDKEPPKISISGCNRAQTSSVDFGKQVTLTAPYCIEIFVVDSVSGVSDSDFPGEGTTIEVLRIQDELLKFYEPVTQPMISEEDFVYKTFKWNIPEKTEEGKYLLKIRAMDGFGNQSLRNLEITISETSQFNIFRAFNAPNPLKENGTCFFFGEISDQNSGEFYVQDFEASAEIRIYNQRGFLVKLLTDVRPRLDFRKNNEQECRERNAWWNGRDKWHNKMANGVYFYEVKVAQRNFNTQNENTVRTAVKNKSLIISR